MSENVSARLGDIAHARSGDKGAGANIGVIARSPAAYEFLRSALTAEVVETYFKPMGVGNRDGEESGRGRS